MATYTLHVTMDPDQQSFLLEDVFHDDEDLLDIIGYDDFCDQDAVFEYDYE